MNKLIQILIFIFTVASCSEFKTNEDQIIQIEKLQLQNDSLKAEIAENKSNMKNQISTFLTFQENNAEQAMDFYVELFENSKIIDIKRYAKGGPAKEGTIMKATFELNGKKFICSDSYIKHEWNFTPGVSNWVECEADEEIENLFEKLSQNGKVMMPLGNYGFSKKFGFVEDRFGISWQLNLE